MPVAIHDVSVCRRFALWLLSVAFNIQKRIFRIRLRLDFPHSHTKAVGETLKKKNYLCARNKF